MPQSGLSVSSGDCSEDPARHKGALLMLGISRPSIFLLLLIFTFVFAVACSSDDSTLATKQAEERISISQFVVNFIIQNHDSTSDRAMDLLLKLQASRGVDTSWREIDYGNISPFSSGESALKEWRTRWARWRVEIRDDLRPEAEVVESIVSEIKQNQREINSFVGNPQFREDASSAMNIQLRVIVPIANWYRDFMEWDTTAPLVMNSVPREYFTAEKLVSLLDDAPTRFLDGRLRWNSAVSAFRSR